MKNLTPFKKGKFSIDRGDLSKDIEKNQLLKDTFLKSKRNLLTERFQLLQI